MGVRSQTRTLDFSVPNLSQKVAWLSSMLPHTRVCGRPAMVSTKVARLQST
jgi:hypothetical protein